MRKKSKPPIVTDLRQQAEARLRESKKIEKDHPQKMIDSQRMVHELQVHRIELEMQNSALIESQVNLQKALNKYSDLYDFAPVGYFTVSRNGTILEVNLSGTQILGEERRYLLKRQFGLFVSIESRPAFNHFIEKIFASQEKVTCELALKNNENKPLWVQVEATSTPDGQACSLALVDVTARKQIEQSFRILSDTQSQLVHSEDFEDVYQLVGNRIQELTGDGYIIITELDESLQLIRTAGLFGFGSGYDSLVKRFHIDPSKMTYPLKDIRPDEMRLFRSGKLEKFPGGLYNLLLRKVPESICKVAEKKLGILEFYTMGFIRHGIHFGGVTILAKSDITAHKPFIEIIIQQASMAINRIRSDSELRESEERFRSLYENATLGMYRTTPDGRIVLANPALVRMLGYPSFEELTQRNLEKEGYETGYSRQDFKKQIGLKGELYGIESAWKRKDGTAIFVRESAKAIREQNGKVIYYEGTVEDISERHTAEKALRESEAHFRGLFENSPISLWEEDFSAVKNRLDELKKQGISDIPAYLESHPKEVAHCVSLIRVVDVNKATLKLFHFKNKAQLLKPLSDFLSPQTLQEFREELTFIAEGKTHFEWEKKTHTETGELIDVLLSWSTAPGHENDLSKVIISFIDITERRKAENAIRDSEERYRNLFEDSPIALWEEDHSEVKNYLDKLKLKGITNYRDYFNKHFQEVKKCLDLIRILNINNATLKLYNANDKSEIIKGLSAVFTESALTNFIEQLVKIANGEKSMDQEIMEEKLTGEKMTNHIYWQVAPGYEDSFSRVIVSVIDITERRNAENALQESEAHFRGLFENSPISLWEEDFSAVKKRLDEIKKRGISDIHAYLESHPKEVAHLVSLIRVVDVNNTALKLFQTNNKADLLQPLSTVLSPQALQEFRKEFDFIIEAKSNFELETRCQTMTGKPMELSLSGSVSPGHESDLSSVFISMIDITERRRAEIALQESENQYRSLFEDSPISLKVEDNSKVKKTLDGLKKKGVNNFREYFKKNPQEVKKCLDSIKILDLNNATLKIYGATDKSEIIKGLSAVFSESSYTGYAEQLIQIADGKRTIDLETEAIKINGEKMTHLVRWQAAPGFEDSLSRVIVSVIDITDRKQAEENIHLSEQALKKAQSVAHVGSWKWDIKKNKLTWSDEMYHIFGITKEKFSGVLADVMAQAIHPEDRPAVEASNISVMRDKKPIPLEYRVVWPDKSIHWVWAEAGELILDVNGESEVLTGIVQDITARKMADEELRSSEQKYRTLTEQASDGIFQLDKDGRFIYANTRTCEMLGYSLDEILTLTIYDTYQPQEIEEGKKRVAKINEGNSLHFERLMVARDGRTFPVEISANQLSNGTMQSICRDISERKKNEEAFRKHALLQENMASFGHALAATLDLQEIYRISNQYLQKMVDCSNFGITLFDPKKGELQAAFLISDGIEMDVNLLPKLKYQSDQSSSGRSKAIATQSPIITRDLESKRKAGGGKLIGSSREPQSAIYVPMLVEGKVLGLLDLQSYAPDAYSAEDSAWLSVIANQIGLNIQNAFLYQSLQMEMKELARAEKRQKALTEKEHKQRIFSEALTKNALSLNSTLKTQELLDVIINNIQNVIPFEAVSIIIIEEGQGKIVRSKGFVEKELSSYIDQTRFDFSQYTSFQKIIDTGSYVLIADTRADPTWIQESEKSWKILSTLQTPIKEDNKVIGFLILNSSIAGFYNEEHAQQLMVFTDQVSNAMKNARLFEDTQRRMKRMNAMTLIDQAINSSLDIHVALEMVLIQTMEQLGADASDILMANYVSNTLTYAKAKGFRTNEITKSNLGLGAGLSGQAVMERKAISIPDLRSVPESYFRNFLINKEGFISYYCVPLITKGLLKGVMEVFFRKAFEADREWLAFFELLGQQTAIAINNAELLNSLQISNNDLKNAYDATLQGWVEALDLRDSVTESHSLRVVEKTLLLAKLMNIEDEKLNGIKRGAFLHDIGKISISDSILNKTSALSEEEWKIMRKHPEYAFQLLSKTKYLKDALDIPYCHHEKWDGSGYPRGLKGEDIPIVARIFAIINVWDVLISDRPYRSAWSKEKALDYIQEQSGKHFDPQVVEIFINNFNLLND